MFERYVAKSRRAIFFAREEALHRSSNEIDTGDLILGLCREGHSPNCPFARLHADDAKLRQLLERGLKPTECAPARTIPLTADAKRSLAFAKQEADLDGRYAIGRDHLLRGVLLCGDATSRTISDAGYTLDEMRAASKIAYQTYPDVRPSFFSRLVRSRNRVVLLACLAVALIIFLYLYSQR